MDFLSSFLLPVYLINHAGVSGNAILQSGIARSTFSGYNAPFELSSRHAYY